MKKLLLFLFITCIIYATGYAQISSNGTGGGEWNSNGTWQGDNIPVAGQDVIITGSDVVTILSTDEFCDDIIINSSATLTITGGSLTTTHHFEVNGIFNFTNGTLNIGDQDSDYFDVSSSGTINISGGTINVGGRYKQLTGGNAYFSEDAIMNISTSGEQTSSISSLSVTTSGVFSVANGSTVQIVIKYANTGDNIDFYYSPANSSFLGGSVIFENASDESNLYIDSDEPIYKIESKVGSGKTFHFNSDCNFSLTDLTISSGAVQVDLGAQLTTTGTVTTNNALVIESTELGTGSLIASGTVTGMATIQRYLTNYGVVGDNKYHFISSPVTVQTIQPDFVASSPATDVDFYSYDEATNYWINTKDGSSSWNTSFEDDFVVGKGYLVAYPSAITKEFVGTLNSYTAASKLVIPCTNTNGNGWNLLGNPFTSAFDWNLVDDELGDGMDDALYYYDSEAANYRYYIQLSGESGALGSGSQYIPSGQGFMVHAKTTGTKTVTLYDYQQAHSNQAFYKSSNTLDDLLILKINRDGYEDETTVLFYPEATNEFDGSFDAYKLYSYSTQMPQIYSINNDINLAINSLKSIDETPNVKLGYKTQVAGTFEFNASGIESYISSGDIMLEDALLNTIHDLSLNQSYTFASEVGTFDNRFILHFGPTGINNPNQSPNQIQIWSANNTIQVINNQNLVGDISIVNLFGQVIANYNLTGDTKQQVNFTATSGLYIVNVKACNGVVSTKKLYIK